MCPPLRQLSLKRRGLESADAPHVLERQEVDTEAVRKTPAGDETYPTGRHVAVN